MNQTFCKFFNNGLVYNNDVSHFTVAPCCYFAVSDKILPDQPVKLQFEQYKKQWLTADLNRHCRVCIDQEASGITSYRQAANDIIKTDTDKLTMLTVAVNKKCNLACPSCGPESSSFWYQENLRNGVSQSTDVIQLHQEDREHTITEKFLELLATQDLSDLEYIKFGGGEPLMNDTHLLILDLVPNPSKVTIQYTSNFSIMPSAKTMDTWQRFKLVKWVASIDGVGDQFEFLRWPYSWSKLQEFKERAFAQVPANVMFGVEHTLNPLNIFYYNQFQYWFDTEFAVNRLGDQSDLNLHYATGIMGLDKTPNSVKHMIMDRYGDHPITRLLHQMPLDQDTTELVKYLDKIDAWRHSQWRKLFPEVEKYYV